MEFVKYVKNMYLMYLCNLNKEIFLVQLKIKLCGLLQIAARIRLVTNSVCDQYADNLFTIRKFKSNL